MTRIRNRGQTKRGKCKVCGAEFVRLDNWNGCAVYGCPAHSRSKGVVDVPDDKRDTELLDV